MQNSSDIITALAADGTILYQSPSTERLLGHRPEDRIGRNIFVDRLAHPEDWARKRAFLDERSAGPAYRWQPNSGSGTLMGHGGTLRRSARTC